MELLLNMLICVLVVGFGSIFAVLKIDKSLRKQDLKIEENNKALQRLKN